MSTSTPLYIIYGTMTGNAENLAETLGKRCEAEGIAHEVVSVEDWPLERFKDAGRTVLIFSTWGDGEPPDEAVDFCEDVYDDKAEVSHLEYAVVGLGDSSYDDFCGCARRLDEAFERGGAKRLIERVELDVDYDDDFADWLDRFFAAISANA